jgi:hypothetical protein
MHPTETLRPPLATYAAGRAAQFTLAEDQEVEGGEEDGGGADQHGDTDEEDEGEAESQDAEDEDEEDEEDEGGDKDEEEGEEDEEEDEEEEDDEDGEEEEEDEEDEDEEDEDEEESLYSRARKSDKTGMSVFRLYNQKQREDGLYVNPHRTSPTVLSPPTQESQAIMARALEYHGIRECLSLEDLQRRACP